jgi:LacI family transcriptional regulator
MSSGPTRGKSGVTIREVAAQAGVSVAAVSRYVNGRQRFTPEVEARMDAAIAAVGYHSNPMARAMATGRSDAVAVLVGGIEQPPTAALIKGVSRAAQRTGVHVLVIDIAPVAPGKPGLHDELLERALALQVDGLLLAAEMPPGTAEQLARMGRPFIDVASARRVDGCVSAGLGVVFACAGEMIGQHLLLGGHERLAYIHCEASMGSTQVARGLQAAVGARAASEGCAALEQVSVVEPTAEAAASVASTLLLRSVGERPDAVVTCSDALAMGLAREATQLGLVLPRDLSLASVGNSPDAPYLQPPLTSVELQLAIHGELAMLQLLALIGGRTDAPRVAPAARLVVRGSTSPRRGGGAALSRGGSP